MSSVILKNAALNSAKWTTVEKFFVQVLQFVIQTILARLLAPADFGIIGMISVFLIVSQQFLDSGFSIALIRKQDCEKKDYSTAFYFNIFVGLIFSVFFFFISDSIAVFYKMPDLSLFTKVLGLNLFLLSLSIVQKTIYVKKFDFKSIAINSILSISISGFVGILLAYNGYGVWALITQMLLNSFIASLIFWIHSSWRPQWVFSIPSFKYMFSYGSKLLLTGIISSVMSNVTSLIIGKRYTSSDLGYYTRAEKFATVPSMALFGIFQSVLYPLFSSVQDNNDELIKVQKRVLQCSSCLLFFLMLLLCVLARPLILFLLTEKWSAAIVILQLLCISSMFSHIGLINIILIQVVGRSDLVLKYSIMGIPITLLILFAAMSHGIIAICIGYIVGCQLKLLFPTYYVGKLFHYGYIKQFKDFISYLILSIICIVPTYYFFSCIISDYLVQIVIVSILSFSMYLICLFFKKDIVCTMLLSIINKKIKIFK